jgi:hypothetical protein
VSLPDEEYTKDELEYIYSELVRHYEPGLILLSLVREAL